MSEQTNTAKQDAQGWIGIDPDSVQLQELREFLERNNGLRGLEILEPTDVEEAVRLFLRDGFVVVANALNGEQLEYLRAGCNREIERILEVDPGRIGNRGSHRYSFGGASLSHHQMHNPEWAMLLDLPTVTPILSAIFNSTNYIARGGGGDFCLPGAIDYQPLHSDMGDSQTFGRHASFHDPRGTLSYRDLPCPYVCCNYLMVDFTPTNGPTRQIPGTQNTRQPMPSLDQEPQWMKTSTVCPAPAGAVLIRDVRAWHGGTPNLSNQVRAIPNAEYFAPWYREEMAISIPHEIYQTLSEHAQRICRYITAPRGKHIKTGYENFA